jgi:hypothetical protein
MGTSENAVRTPIAAAFIAYILVRMLQVTQPQHYAAAVVLPIARAHICSCAGPSPNCSIRDERHRQPSRSPPGNTSRLWATSVPDSSGVARP